MGRPQHMQIQRLLLRKPPGQPLCRRRRFHRLQRLPALRPHPRRIPRRPPRSRPLPRKFQLLLRRIPPRHHQSPLPLRNRHQQQQILRALPRRRLEYGHSLFPRHPVQFLLRRRPAGAIRESSRPPLPQQQQFHDPIARFRDAAWSRGGGERRWTRLETVGRGRD
ncbi:hypothetical protein ACS0TY_007729 [Phlomoides rotata]